VVALRNKVQATVDDSIDEAAVRVTAVLTDGRRVKVNVDHAIGSLENPLTDAQLEAKFASLVVPVLGQARTDEITQHCRTLASVADIRTLTALCAA
jgi:2-methylcitrate dehydratase PrpD